MIWLWCALALAAPVRFERVDFLSEDSPTFLVDTLPGVASTPRFTAIRTVEQVGVVWALGDHGLTVSTALGAQGVHYEREVLGGSVPLFAGGGVITRLGLPAGARLGLAARTGRWRLGLSVGAMSAASWARPRWEGWRVLPSVGIGFGRQVHGPGPAVE